MKLLVVGLVAFLGAGCTSDVAGQSTGLDRLKTYIEIDTTNPPGNESRGVEFFAKIFDEAGIAYESVESAPGRGNIWARLEGGDEPALVMLHHIDVVPATPAQWDTDPFKAVERDGVLHGRGAVDTKGLGIVHLEAFLALHRSGMPLNRDVIFMATADEEAGGLFGAGWLVENRPELFANVGFLINEGGGGVDSNGEIDFRIELAQKRPYWLRLTATDTPGHGSSPRSTSAPTRLIEALHRIHMSPFEPRIAAPVRSMFQALSLEIGEPWQASFANIDEAVLDPAFLSALQADQPGLHALLRNTCSITMLTGSAKINVVPPVATAELDCRILPDQDAAEFLDGIRARVADDQIEIEEIMLFGAADSSPDTELFRTLERITLEHYPGAGFMKSVSTGFTDSHFFRDLGIISYGYSPIVLPEAFRGGVHGNNERIGISGFEKGIDIMIEILTAFAGPGAGE